MNNDNRNRLEDNNEDRFATLDIDGINDIYYGKTKRSKSSPKKKRSNNVSQDMLKIVALLVTIIFLIVILYTAVVGILGSGYKIFGPSTTEAEQTTASKGETASTTPSADTSSVATLPVIIGTSSAITSAITSATTSTTVTQTQTSATTTKPTNPAYKDAIIFIDAGHGGKDPGSLGKLDGQTYNEKDINLSVALRVREELEKRGFTVVMSRDTDVFVELEDRAELALEANADMFVSLHCNSFSKDTVAGPRMYYTARNGVTYDPKAFAKYFSDAFDTVKNRVGDSGQVAYPNMKKANIYSDSSVLGKDKHYAVLCNTNMPSILIEMGFITNENDLRMLASIWWQTFVARAIADAIESSYNAGFVTK